MKGKYITTHVRMAYLSAPVVSKRSIHEQLEETIAERKKIIAILSLKTQDSSSLKTQDNSSLKTQNSVIDLYLGTTKAA